jgi:hypothetical protein
VETVSTCTKACKMMLRGIFDKNWLIQEENYPQTHTIGIKSMPTN